MERLDLRRRPTFRSNYLGPALAAGLIEITDPNSPRSPVQRYRLTDKGRTGNGDLFRPNGRMRVNFCIAAGWFDRFQPDWNIPESDR